MLSAEVGDSLVTQNTQAILEKNIILSDVQQWLSSQYDWPQLDDRQDQTFAVGQRYAIAPTLQYFDRPNAAWVYWSNRWMPLTVGISQEQFNYLNSDLYVGLDPVQRWRIADQIQIAEPGAPTLAAGSAGNPTGVFVYGITFVTAFGETSLGTTATITVTNKQVELTGIPLGEDYVVPGGGPAAQGTLSPVTSRNIYRTENGGDTFYFIGELADNTTTTFTDVYSDATIVTAPEPPEFNTAEVLAYELWPLPQTAGTIRFEGQRLLNPLEQDTDCADLDDQCIVLFAAAKLLARRRKADAPEVLTRAETRLVSVRSNWPRREKMVVFGQRQDWGRSSRRLVPMIAVAGSGSGGSSGTVLGPEISGDVLGPG